MAWLVAAFILAITVAWAFRRLRLATIYLSHPGGYVATTFGGREGKLRPVPRDRYERILRRFVQGDLFDSLWIAYRPGDNDGLVVSLDGDEIEMHVSFRALKESDRLVAFREGMMLWDYVPVSEQSWNVGMGENLESVTLEYRFAKDLELVSQAVERALAALEEPAGSEVFVHAWRSQNGPRGIGLKIVPNADVLADIP